MSVVTLLACGAGIHGALCQDSDGGRLTAHGCSEDDIPNCDPCGQGRGLGEICCGPLWTANADVVFLTRSTPAASLIVDGLNETEILSSSAFEISYHAGFELSLERHFECDNAIEFRYLGVDRWNSQASLPTNRNEELEINADDKHVFTPAGTSLDASYASQVHSFEINGRHSFCGDRLAVLAGFRYAELDEGWGFTLVEPPTPFTFGAVTRNRLYGFQLGGQAVLWDGGGLSVEGIGKGGIYGNCAAQDSMYTTGIITFPSHGSTTEAAFLGELGLTGKYQLTERLSARGGYQLLWINGVALAPSQLAVTDFVLGMGISAAQGAFYHGAFAGLEYGY